MSHATKLYLGKIVENGLVKSDAIQFLQKALIFCKSDDLFTDAEEQYILHAKDILGVSNADFANIAQDIAVTKMVQHIRLGNLPTVQSSVVMSSGEICHWQCAATYHKALKNSTKQIFGSLHISSHKVRFISNSGGFEFPLSKIASFRPEARGTKGINLTLTRSGGNGYYGMTESPIVLCELLNVLLNKHHRLEVYKQESSRSVPQNVRAAVWQRDGGKCIQCSAVDYLEFDHIIPFSKGGATSENNLQLLCRRCNLQKSDKL